MKKLLIIFSILALSACASQTPDQAKKDVTSASSKVDVNVVEDIPADEKVAPPVETINTTDSALKSIALSEISTHSTKGDCWMAINGKVYDVSKYENHPGGEAILLGCGKDATTLFESRPGSGTPHPEKARTNMVKFEIGTLAQ